LSVGFKILLFKKKNSRIYEPPNDIEPHRFYLAFPKNNLLKLFIFNLAFSKKNILKLLILKKHIIQLFLKLALVKW
jgi:hypothetical protein